MVFFRHRSKKKLKKINCNWAFFTKIHVFHELLKSVNGYQLIFNNFYLKYRFLQFGPNWPLLTPKKWKKPIFWKNGFWGPRKWPKMIDFKPKHWGRFWISKKFWKFHLVLPFFEKKSLFDFCSGGPEISWKKGVSKSTWKKIFKTDHFDKKLIFLKRFCSKV